jgi:iron complex outermembrane recepter protein
MLITTLSIVSQAQNNQKVTGNIHDDVNKPIDAVTVSLLKATDSSLVKVAATKNGYYEFDNIAPGKYLVTATSVAHNKQFSGVFEVSTGSITVVQPVILTHHAKSLSGVTVTGRKQMVEHKADKMIVNVETAVSNAGATALEVLEKSPGVTIDKDGNISLKGKQAVMVMFDGRPTYLSATELSNMLKSMPASSVETIEIMTNPSAKYDAAGNSGIINIKTKKNKQKGFNGNATANYGQGAYWRSNNSLNVNYRNGKVNLFANGGVSFWNSFQLLDITRRYTNAGTRDLNAIFEQNSFMRNAEKNYALKFGADYYLNKKTTLGIVFNGALSPEKNLSENTSYLKNKNGITDSIVYAETVNKTDWKNGSVNLNLRHQFDSTGKELTADVDYLAYRNPSDMTFMNTSFTPQWVKNNSENLMGNLPVYINIYTAKIDYTQPFGKNGKIETGVKSSYVKTQNEANYFNLLNDKYEVDYQKTNHFLYQENINAAYLNYNKQIKKWGLQTGLRYENTNYTGMQNGNPTKQDSSFKRNYGSLFPTIYISYEAGKIHQLSINYGRRIDRPAYQDLNPFVFFLDKYTYQSGNPFIQPQFSHNVELGHTYKGFLNTTVNYSFTKNLMTETFEQSGYATIVRKGNIGKRYNAGIAINAQIPVKKWWSSMLYANYNYSKFAGKLYGDDINIAAGNLLVNVNNQFNFNKGWSAELSGFYRTKGIEGQIQVNPLGQVAAGVGKQVLKGKGSIKFNIRDLFYTQTVNGKIQLQNTEAKFKNARDSRVGTISFVYRFGKPIKGARQRTKIGGADDEKNRVKSGSNN